MFKEKIRVKLMEKSIKVGVYGLGKQGWPLMARNAMEGFYTVGFSMQPAYVESTNNGVNFWHDTTVPDDPKVTRRLVYDEHMHGTTDLSFVTKADILFVCVKDLAEELNLSAQVCAEKYAEGIAAFIRPDTAVIFITGGDVPNLYMDKIITAMQGVSGLTVEQDFTVACMDIAHVLAGRPGDLLAEAIA